MIGLVYKGDLPQAVELARALRKRLSPKHSVWMTTASKLDGLGDKIEKSTTIVTVGGDGTILRTVRVVAPYSVPLLGVNLGRVGFMTEIRAKDALEQVPDYLDGGCRSDERMMLEASVESEIAGSVTVHALNDVVVGRPLVARLVDVEVRIDGAQLTTYRADGVIMSTATGSTAYALSAGGPIVSPEANVMLIHPVAAHTGLRAGLVLPGVSIVELRVSGSLEATLTADGFTSTPLGANHNVVVRRSPYVARFLRRGPPSDFYASLTRRLGMTGHSTG